MDESGDPNFFGRRHKDLVQLGLSLPFFIVGYIETQDQNQIVKKLSEVRASIINDEYLKDIPSVKSSIKRFHANKDCREVQERVYKAIKTMDFECYIIVARKIKEIFLNKFQGKKGGFYAYLVERLFENRLHLYSEIDIYFSKMENIIHDENMWKAIENARDRFRKKWPHKHTNNIRILMQEPTHIAGLQVIDYLLWSIHRIYNHADMRYYNFLKDKIKLIHDVFFNKDFYGEFFNSKNELTLDKIGIKK